MKNIQLFLDASRACAHSSLQAGCEFVMSQCHTRIVGARSDCDSNVTEIKAVFFKVFIYLLTILLISAVSCWLIRWFRSFQLFCLFRGLFWSFRWFCFGRFISLFRVLVHACWNTKRRRQVDNIKLSISASWIFLMSGNEQPKYTRYAFKKIHG